MPGLSFPVVYTVPTSQQTTTVKTDGPNKGTLEGSVFHPSLRSFAGIIGEVQADGTYGLIIFPPQKPPVWVDGAKYGAGPGGFTEPGFESETAAPPAVPAALEHAS